jgi:transposase-like protein
VPKREAWFGPDDTAACVRLEQEVRDARAWGDASHALFQEYVAREHLDGGMPIVELHRNHGVPLSAVRRWIATFRDDGRQGLEREAREANARAKKRESVLVAKGVTPKELDALRAAIASHDIEAGRAAYATIAKRKLTALVPAIVEAVRWKDQDKRRGGWSIQDELELLAALKAKDALHELVTSKLKIMRGYSSWLPGLLERAGCEVKTVQKPFSRQYAIDGAWFPIPK